MNRRQKVAWYQLSLVAAAAVLGVVLMAHFVRIYEYSFVDAWWYGMGYAVLVLILTVFGPLFFRKKKGQVDYDERDLIIDRRAAWIAFGATYAYFILACMITWVVAGVESLIPAYWLTRIVIGGWVTAIVTNAAMVLVFYSRGVKDGQ
jgi:uncharacterized membrane protein